VALFFFCGIWLGCSRAGELDRDRGDRRTRADGGGCETVGSGPGGDVLDDGPTKRYEAEADAGVD